MYSYYPSKSNFKILDEMGHVSFLLDEMGLDEMGLDGLPIQHSNTELQVTLMLISEVYT